MPPHAHDYYEFVYFLGGSGRIHIASDTLHPRLYHLVVFPPGVTHEELSDRHAPEEIIFLSTRVHGLQPNWPYLLLADFDGQFRWLFQQVAQENQRCDWGHRQVAEGYLQAIFHLVERQRQGKTDQDLTPTDRAVRFVHEHFAEALSLAEIARAAQISPSHLIRRFREQLGTSPVQYVQRVRVETAKHLLITTPLRVGEVGEAVGFPDPGYFTRVFHTAVGMSPSAFRRGTAVE